MRGRVIWVFAAVVVTALFGIIFTTAWLSLDAAADDPQISMAQNFAAKLDAGSGPATLLGNKIEITTDASPFIIVYGLDGNIVAGNGYLGGSIPTIPLGVLKHSKGSSAYTVTWQPTKETKIAVASVRSHNYYVLSGRVMTDTERRINAVGLYIISIWLISMAGIAAANVIANKNN